MEVNPFFNQSINITDKELYLKFSRILLICLKNNVKHNDEILNPTINDINEIMKNYTILETKNLRLVKDISNKLMIINSSILSKYFDYEFKNEELVIMMYLVDENSLKIYLKQHNGLTNLEEYITSIFIDKYLNRKYSCALERINKNNIIKTIDESNFWSLNICKLNNTQTFINRRFNHYKINDIVKKNTLTNAEPNVEPNAEPNAEANAEPNTEPNIEANIEANAEPNVEPNAEPNQEPNAEPNVEPNTEPNIEANAELNTETEEFDYFSYLEKSIENDITETKKIKYNLYYITEHPLTNKMSIEDFNIIVKHLVDNKYSEEFYYLVINLLSSKELCHYIINNKYVLEIINKSDVFIFQKSFLEKYMPIIKYILGYTWITLYTEESIKKINLTTKDRFIFNIETASLLPFFPFNIFDPKSSPYLPILVSDVALSMTNFFPVLPVYTSTNKYNYGVCNLDTFRSRLSIFFSNTEKNMLEGLDFNGIGITGSSIACCLPNFNPLHLIFDNFNNFVKEYYNNADLDIISNLSDFEFVDKYHHIIDVLENNISTKLGKLDVKINSTFIKTVFISVNDDYIKNNFNISKDEIDFNNIEIKQHFYNKYIEEKSKKFDNIDKLEKYKCIYDNADIDKLNIVYKPNIYYQCNENIKYKISTPYTKVIEYFQVKADDFFKVLSSFHLPIVRAYYNGSTVYMTPSCVSACMTLYNLDVKYFTSNICPVEILNKYRQRGFGVFVNKYEKIKIMDYSSKNTFWKIKYNIFKKSNMKYNIFDAKDIKNNFYNITEKNNYNEFNKILEEMKILKILKITSDFSIYWKEFLYLKYKSIELRDLNLTARIINYNGSVTPLNKNYIIIAHTLL